MAHTPCLFARHDDPIADLGFVQHSPGCLSVLITGKDHYYVHRLHSPSDLLPSLIVPSVHCVSRQRLLPDAPPVPVHLAAKL